MKDHELNPEAKPAPLKLNCWKCNHAVTGSPLNTMSFVYAKQAYFNNTQVIHGDKCGAITVVFHDLVEGMAEVAADYPTHQQDYCDEKNVIDLRQELLSIHDIPSIELSARQLKCIDSIGKFLQSIEVTAEDFV